jgi:hypothetical protein
MPQFGSNPSVASQNFSATQDINGNSVISSDSAFGASPLGVAARTQALFGIPNANFDLTCPDPNSAVEVDNSIPYWGLETNGTISTTMVYNTTTQNWSVRMDPTGAAADDYAILKTRTYLLNDDALALRQKAYASLTRQGTTGTAQWSIVLSATYYDDAGALLSTYNIGTAADTGTWTGIDGITTSGSAAISTSAAYADIALTLTAAGSVSGTAKVDINSVLVATSGATAAGGLVLTQTFLTSGTWTRPTGVDYVTIVQLGAGRGGQSGGISSSGTAAGSATGGNGGTSGAWSIRRDVYVGGVATFAVGIGAGGAGGTANSFTKAAAGTAQSSQASVSGAAGGGNTFGTALSSGAWTDITTVLGSNGALGGYNSGEGATPLDATSAATNVYSSFPYSISGGTAGVAGTAGTGSGGGTASVGTGGTAITGTGYGGGGGGGGSGFSRSSGSITGTNGSVGGRTGSGSGGGGSSRRSDSSSQTVVVTGGNGGDAGPVNIGGGGGGGGGASFAASSSANYNSTTLTMTSGKGGDGQTGFLTVVWVG